MPSVAVMYKSRGQYLTVHFFFFGLAIELTLIFIFNLLTFLVGIFISVYSLVSSDEL